MVIFAGEYSFVHVGINGIEKVLKRFGLNISNDIRIRGVNTSQFTRSAVRRGDAPDAIANVGALHKAIPYQNMMGPNTPVIGVMLVAVMRDGTVLSNAEVWKPPSMTGKNVRFHLGVTLLWKRRIRCVSKKSKWYLISRAQDEINLSIRKIMLEGPVIMPVNPYTTHPESLFSADVAEQLERRLSRILRECISQLIVEVSNEISDKKTNW